MKQDIELIKNKWETRYITVVLIISIVVTAYTVFFTNNYIYNLLWLLPFVYFLSTLFYYFVFININYNYGIVFIVANIIIFIRYVVMPFSIVFTSAYNGLGYGPNPSKTSVNYAIILMVLELIITYMFIIFAIIYYKKRQISLDKDNPTMVLKNKTIVLLFMLQTVPIILVLSPNSLALRSFFSLNEVTSNITQLPMAGGIKIIINCLKLCFLFYGVSLLKRKYNKKKKVIYIIIAWVIVFLYLSSIISSSRWTLLFSIILCILIMKKLFPETPTIFYTILITVGIFGFLAISIYKFSWTVKDSLNPFQDIVKVLFGQFQEYFSGPRVVAQSIDMQKAYGQEIGLITLINDFLGSVPLLADHINQNDRINVYFNRYLNVGNVTHIIPILGCGLSYFKLFPFIFTIISEWLMVRFDFKSKNSPNVEFKYIYAYIGLIFAMCMGFNTQIIWGNFLTNFLPPWILFTLNRKIVIKQRYCQIENSEVHENAFQHYSSNI